MKSEDLAIYEFRIWWRYVKTSNTFKINKLFEIPAFSTWSVQDSKLKEFEEREFIRI